MNDTKPGYKTTEFWVQIAGTVLTALVASGIIPTASPAQAYVTEALFILGAMGYHAGRVITKASDNAAAVPAPVTTNGVNALPQGTPTIDAVSGRPV